MASKSYKGFTLVELLLVVGILGTLTVAILMNFNPLEQVRKGRDAQRKADLATLQRALEIYHNDNNAYPGSTADYKISISGWNWGGSWSPYMQKTPKDPISAKTYRYVSVSNGQGYRVYANLERGGKDPQACSSGTACPNVPSGVTCGSSSDICNYGVTSSNTDP